MLIWKDSPRRDLFFLDHLLPIHAECDGYIFTDYRIGYYRNVGVDRESWVARNCVAVRGDKGQVAQLLGALLRSSMVENTTVHAYAADIRPRSG